ncbi:MAG TPA: VOC family protein [Stellaceae bacterium]|nr:VOC family protein [Stellaceae bacterium]
MSRIFGEMRQIGIVVHDIEKAMKHWVEVCGVGPWFYAERLPLTNYRYKGRPYDTPHLSIALANSGDIQLELIQQRCNTPSLYWDFLNAGHEGGQHWSSWPVNYHEIREKALASGWHIGQEGDSARGPFIYFLEEGHPGTVIEMAEATPTRMRIFDQVREAAKNWDGSDPIRLNWPSAD